MAQLTLQQTFDLALQHHQAGRLREAEQLYRQVLAQQPEHLDAIHNLGVIAHQAGRNDLAVDLIRRALALRPNFPEAYTNLGNALRDQGHLEEAIAACRQAIALKPDFPEAHCNLGNALKEKGELDEAIAAYRQAIAINPNYAEAHSNLGNALRDKGELDEAIAACRQAITLRPNYAEAHVNLGNALTDKKQHHEAIAAYRQAIALRPNYAKAYLNLGNALSDKGQFDEAIAAYRQAIALKPNLSEAYDSLGTALADKGQFDDAIAIYRQAIAMTPSLSTAYNHLGNALIAKGQFDDAITVYEQGLRLNPENAKAHTNFALSLLLHGHFERGWMEYEWRSKVHNLRLSPREFSQPLWDGGDLKGRTILLHAEQGIGDTIQFIRYLPWVVERGGKVLVEAQAGLIRLLRQLPGVERWIPRGAPLPAFEVHCPLLSLPRLFQTTLQTIPAQKDILIPDPDLAQAWRRRLEQQPPGFKVGLVWAGSSTHKNDRNRSIALSLLAPLATVAGIHFYSLQKGQTAAQAAHPPAGMRIIDWTDDLHDFADTAALVAQLDLIISVDTSVAHLAAAMGKPVWVLLPFVLDWRWMENRDDSPWYPTMRLFRQTTFGDWPGVIGRVVEALAVLDTNQGPFFQ